MIIGDGDIASVLPHSDDLLFFASGVSNSQETRESEYQRDEALLLKQDRSKHIVYFGSLSIFYSDNRYSNHKIRMEHFVKTLFPRYTILRLGNISWGNNPHTIINFLRANPDAPIEDVYRFVINEEEFLYWINLIPEWNCEMNCPGRRMKVQEIVDKYVR